MFDEEIKDIRTRLAALPKNSGGRRQYTAVVKREVIAFAKARVSEGWSRKRVGEALGINKATMTVWLGAKPKKRAGTSAVIKPVVTTPKIRSSTFTLVMASGHRVEGLSIEQLAHLLGAHS